MRVFEVSRRGMTEETELGDRLQLSHFNPSSRSEMMVANRIDRDRRPCVGSLKGGVVKPGAVQAVVGVLLVTLVTGCSPPPPPTAETAALEPYLLYVEDIGNGFSADDRGEVGVSGGKVCPESDYKTENMGMVRANFSKASADDEIHFGQDLHEHLRSAPPGELAAMMGEMKAAYQVCDGAVWTDYGDGKMLTVLDAPALGDGAIAVQTLIGDAPDFDGRRTESRTVLVHQGDVFLEVTIEEEIEGRANQPLMSDEEFYRIVARAVERLPG
jgi:hypothetical protein